MSANDPLDLLARLDIDWELTPLAGGKNMFLDLFKHRISAGDGLPPYAQARILNIISNILKKTRAYPCLLVSVVSPGRWFIDELNRLVKRTIPILILPSGRAMENTWEFQPHALSAFEKEAGYPWMRRSIRSSAFNFTDSQVRILRIMARVKTAHTPEITSLAGFSRTHVRNLLKALQAYQLIEWKRIGKYDGWQIRIKGLRLAHRSWMIPKGVHFAAYRREHRYAGERHRRVARMWRAWLETAYQEIEIWECWTEVPVHYGIPDALAWGTHHGQERLFWLEVDTGHSSKKVMKRNYERRLKIAYKHSCRWGIPIVFCIMGPPWVVDAFRGFGVNQYQGMAVIGHDWREFGVLPIYNFESWRDDLDQTSGRRKFQSKGELPFDPAQYPPKPKMKTLKVHKPKSNKTRFSICSDDDDFRSSTGEFERTE